MDALSWYANSVRFACKCCGFVVWGYPVCHKAQQHERDNPGHVVVREEWADRRPGQMEPVFDN